MQRPHKAYKHCPPDTQYPVLKGLVFQNSKWLKGKGKNMDKKSILGRLRGRLDTTLILFELVLSVIFLLVSYLTGNSYFKGVGVGLIIAWATSALAYFRADVNTKRKKAK